MKKLLAFAAALSIASPVAIAVPTTAAASPSGVTRLCRDLLDSEFGVTQGNCVATFNTGVPNANAICHFLQSNYPVDFTATFSSFGACVSVVNVYLGKS